MGREITLYKDRAGNKLLKRYIKTRKIWQYFVKNREGRIVKPSEFNKMVRRSGIKGIAKATRKGIQTHILKRKIKRRRR